jgi:hypothetical protein
MIQKLFGLAVSLEKVTCPSLAILKVHQQPMACLIAHRRIPEEKRSLQIYAEACNRTGPGLLPAKPNEGALRLTDSCLNVGHRCA